MPLRSRDTVDLGGASRASTVFGVMEEGLISSGVRNLRVPLHFKTPIAGSLQSWDRRVRPHLEWRNGTLLASRAVHGMTGLLSSCVWNLRLLPNDARECQ